MTSELKVTRARGGFRRPLSVRNFIQDHLLFVGEDYIANMHRAYKAELDNIARRNNRKYAYHKPVYHSFEMAVQKLTREGIIEFSGREEESDNPQFAGWEVKPVRRYYRMVEGGTSPTGELLTRGLASDLTNGHGPDTNHLGELPELRTSTNGRQPAANHKNGNKRH